MLPVALEKITSSLSIFNQLLKDSGQGEEKEENQLRKAHRQRKKKKNLDYTLARKKSFSCMQSYFWITREY